MSWTDTPLDARHVFPAKLTAVEEDADGRFRYSWRELSVTIDGGLSDDAPAREGFPEAAYALALNNEEIDVSGEPEVWLRLRGVVSGTLVYEFMPPSKLPDDFGILVEDTDFPPLQYFDVQRVQFHNGDGFWLSDTVGSLPNAVRVNILEATPTQRGIVSIDTQAFYGNKEFHGTASTPVTLGKGVGVGTSDLGHFAVVVRGVGASTPWSLRYGMLASPNRLFLQKGLESGSAGDTLNQIRFELDDAIEARFHTWDGAALTQSSSMSKVFRSNCFATYSHTGVSGTIGVGATCHGGLVVSLGSGGVTTVNGVGGSVTITNGTGISVNTAGSTITIGNTGVTSLTAGTGINVSAATGAVTVTNTGVTSAVAGNGVAVSGATGAVTFSAVTQMSVTVDGSGIKLVNDSGSPGNNYYYGTNGSGTKGFYALPAEKTLMGSAAIDVFDGGSYWVIINLGVTSATAGTGISITPAGTGDITIANTGVTSVALTAPALMTVSGSPVTTTGTLDLDWDFPSGNLAGRTSGGDGDIEAVLPTTSDTVTLTLASGNLTADVRVHLAGGLEAHTGGLRIIPGPAYTPTNVTTDRSYDADSTTLDEVADVLGTLIADLKAVNILT